MKATIYMDVEGTQDEIDTFMEKLPEGAKVVHDSKMKKRRYMIQIEVLEVDEEGNRRDCFERYKTELAIDDPQEASYIAGELINKAAEDFGDRDDCSPVEPESEGEPTP